MGARCACALRSRSWQGCWLAFFFLLRRAQRSQPRGHGRPHPFFRQPRLLAIWPTRNSCRRHVRSTHATVAASWADCLRLYLLPSLPIAPSRRVPAFVAFSAARGASLLGPKQEGPGRLPVGSHCTMEKRERLGRKWLIVFQGRRCHLVAHTKLREFEASAEHGQGDKTFENTARSPCARCTCPAHT